MSQGDEPLADLRWHWPCYIHTHPEPDVWVSIRKDDRTALRSDTPYGLLLLIRQDYQDRPVPRGS